MDKLLRMQQTKRLPVYYEGIFIYPTVNDILNGAVVDVKFTIRYWKIKD